MKMSDKKIMGNYHGKWKKHVAISISKIIETGIWCCLINVFSSSVYISFKNLTD